MKDTDGLWILYLEFYSRKTAPQITNLRKSIISHKKLYSWHKKHKNKETFSFKWIIHAEKRKEPNNNNTCKMFAIRTGRTKKKNQHDSPTIKLVFSTRKTDITNFCTSYIKETKAHIYLECNNLDYAYKLTPDEHRNVLHHTSYKYMMTFHMNSNQTNTE